MGEETQRRRELRKAKALYLVYGGSEFGMSRNGVDGVFRDYAVPAEVRTQWNAELADAALCRLRDVHAPADAAPAELRGEWEAELLEMNLVWLRTMQAHAKQVDFLVERERPEYLPDVIGSTDRPYDLAGGSALLESMLRYVDLCDAYYDQAEIVAALEHVRDQAQVLLRRARAIRTRARIERISDECAARLAARVPGGAP